MATLDERLKDEEYRHWVKAVLCLQYTKDGLVPFASRKSQDLHNAVLAQIRHIGNPSANGLCNTASIDFKRRAIKCCANCNAFLVETKKYCTGTLNLNNFDIKDLHKQPWQLAKLFMNPGQDVTNTIPEQTDLSGILNFVDHCTLAKMDIQNPANIIAVRDIRNRVLHTADMKVTKQDFSTNIIPTLIALLQDPLFLATDPAAQEAVVKINEVVAADFHITKENEGKVLKELATEFRCLSKDLNTKIDDVRTELNRVETHIGLTMKAQEDKLEKELQDREKDKQTMLQEMKAQQDKLENELQDREKDKQEMLQEMKAQQDKLENELQDREKDKQELEKTLQTLDQKIKGDAELVRTLGTDVITIITSIEKNRQDIDKFTSKTEEREREHEQLRQKQADMAAEQADMAVEQAGMAADIENTRQDMDTLISKNEEREREHEQLRQKQADMAAEQADMAADIENLSKKDEKTETLSVTEEDKAQLVQYLKDGYGEKLEVPVLSTFHNLSISKIFTPVIISKDAESLDQVKRSGKHEDALSHKADRRTSLPDQRTRESETLRSYKEILFKGEVLQKRVFLLGRAGAGKTTFCQHLADIWCNDKVSPQFEDADVLKQFRYRFHVSCRFAEASESIFDMICNQLFCEADDEMIDVARQVLKNTPGECLVLVDGIDEWKGSASTATGRRGDIPGLPSRKGLEKCVVLSTSRPERIHMLQTKLDKTCSVLELQGVQEVSRLICSILREAEYPNPEQSCSEFLSQVQQSNLADLMQFPLMLINALNLWDMNKTLSNSMSVNYSNIMEGLFSRAKDANRLKEYEQERRKEISAELPVCFRHTDWCKGNANLLIKLGELGFDLMFGDDQKSSLIFSGQQTRKYLTDNELKICLAVGILSKAQTISRSNRKIDSFSFCHKTFQEFLGALWLSTEQSELISMFLRQFRNTDTVFDNKVFIQMFCGLSPSAGNRFWQYIAVEVIEKDEKINKYRLARSDYDNGYVTGEDRVEEWQELVLQCIKEARNSDMEQYRQLYYLIPDIHINEYTDERDVTLINGLVEKYVADIKSVKLENKVPSGVVQSMKQMQSAISIRLYEDDPNRRSIPLLQLPHQLKVLSIRRVDIASTIEFPKHLTILIVSFCKLSHSDIEQLCSCLHVSSTLRYLHLEELHCSDHGDRCYVPELDLQRHHSLEEVELEELSVESVLLPGQGTISLSLTRLTVDYIKLSHGGIEQLCSCLRVSSTLRYLQLLELHCRDHGDRCYIPALDLQRHHSLEEVKLWRLSVERVLLPGQLERQQTSDLHTIPLLDIEMMKVNMQSQGWRSWLGSLPCLPYRLKVKLNQCNAEEDPKSYIRSCSHFIVTYDRSNWFYFRTKLADDNNDSSDVSSSDWSSDDDNGIYFETKQGDDDDEDSDD